MRRLIIYATLLIICTAGCGKSTRVATLFFSDQSGFIVLQENNDITYYSPRCIKPINWIKKSARIYNDNNRQLIGCRNNPNRKHSMNIDVEIDRVIKITSSDSCFQDIYGQPEMLFTPLRTNDINLGWTHFRISNLNNIKSVSYILSKDEIELKYDSLRLLNPSGVFSLDQQVWLLYKYRDLLFSDNIHPREDYKIELLNGEQILTSFERNIFACYLKELNFVLSYQHRENSLIGIE